jgi:hypothetical protein
MNTRYRPIRVQIPYCIQDREHTVMCQGGKYWEVDALECIGTGPAIQRVWYHPSGWTLWNDYRIVRIKSGTLFLQNTVPTLVEAGMWLRKVRGLCDWTQPANSLQVQEDTKAQVNFAWLDTQYDYHLLVTGKRMLTEEEWGYAESHTGEGIDKA